MDIIGEIPQLETQFLLLATLVLIARLAAIIIHRFCKAKSETRWFNLLAKQPYKPALLIFAIFAAGLVLINQVIALDAPYLSIIKLTVAVVNFGLIIAIVFEEERLLYLYFKDNIIVDSPTLQVMLPLIWHSVRLSLVAIALLILFPINIFPANIQYYLNKAINVVIIWSIAWLMFQLVFSFEKVVLNKTGSLEAGNLQARSKHTRIKIIKRILVAAIVIIAIAGTFMIFKKGQTAGASIFASAGLITALIGFSAQKSMGNLIAGLQIAINEPIKLNDTIIIEGEYGTVEEISLTYVVIKIWDLRRLIVPINYFTVQPFVNLTRSSTNVLCPIIFYTDYTLPIEKVRSYFLEIIQQSELWDKQVATFCIIDATEQTVKVRALASTRTADDSAALKYDMYEKLIKYIYENFPDCLPSKRIKGSLEDAPQTYTGVS